MIALIQWTSMLKCCLIFREYLLPPSLHRCLLLPESSTWKNMVSGTLFCSEILWLYPLERHLNIAIVFDYKYMSLAHYSTHSTYCRLQPRITLQKLLKRITATLLTTSKDYYINLYCHALMPFSIAGILSSEISIL